MAKSWWRSPVSDTPPAAAGGGAAYSVEEERALREAHAKALETGVAAVCPRCQVPLTHRAIGGGSFGLGYSRRREWLLCPSCRRSVLFDAKRGTRT